MNNYTEYMRGLVAVAESPIPEERVVELLSQTKGGVTLSMDGNAGCALLGPNLQEGEAEFVVIDETEHNDGYEAAAKRAIVRAFNRLKARCGGQSLPYHTSAANGLFG